MSSFEVWAAGRPLSGVSPEALLTKVQALFPKATPAQLARFTAGTRFVVTRVPEATAKRVVEALNKAGAPSEYVAQIAQPPAASLPGPERASSPENTTATPAKPRPSRESTAINGTETTGTFKAQRRIHPSATNSEFGRVKDRNGAGLVPHSGHCYRDGAGKLASVAHGASTSGGNTVR